MISFERDISCAGHPSLEGHFPGNPVLPGVVLLEEVLLACRAWAPERQAVGLQSVKFHRPVRPGDRFTIALQTETADRTGFRCSAGETLLCSGIVLWQSAR